MTHCVRWGSLIPRGRGDLGVAPPSETCNYQSYAATRRIQTRSESDFWQITLVLVIIPSHRRKNTRQPLNQSYTVHHTQSQRLLLSKCLPLVRLDEQQDEYRKSKLRNASMKSFYSSAITTRTDDKMFSFDFSRRGCLRRPAAKLTHLTL